MSRNAYGLAELQRLIAPRSIAVVGASPRAMFGRLRGYRLLTGFRGGAGVDLDALADAVARISEFAADFAGEIEEMDVNPLRCGAARIAAVDALITRKGKHTE